MTDPENLNEKGEKKYRRELIRHIVGSALEESDEIDCTEMSYEEIEMILWATAGDVSMGLSIRHPDERELFSKANDD